MGLTVALVIAAPIFAADRTTSRAPASRPPSTRPAAGAATSEPATESAPAVPGERAAFATEDGVEIIGDFHPPPRSGRDRAPFAILLHGARADRKAWAPLVPALHDAGLAVLAIDLRGHGESAGPGSLRLAQRAADRDPKLFRDMHKDVTAAYLWLAKRRDVDPARYVLIGADVGSAVALDCAARDISIDAIVCLSPPTQAPGLDAGKSLRACDARRVLFVADAGDREAVDTLRPLGTDVTVRLIAASPTGEVLRGTAMLGRVRQLDMVIAEFVRDAVGPPARDPVVFSIKSRTGVYHDAESGTARRINDENRRWLSSPDEAEQRGLRAAGRRAAKDDERDDDESGRDRDDDERGRERDDRDRGRDRADDSGR